MATNDQTHNPGSTNNPDTQDTTRSTYGSHSDQERRQLHESKERLAYDFKEMLASAEALLRSTAKYTGAEVEEARARLQDQLDLARNRSGDVKESIRDAGQIFASRTDECVHKHPWQCIGIAFVTGMVFAHCTRSRD